MRTLEFQVEKQRLMKKKDCDFSMIVAGSVNYLKMKFQFSPEWFDCKKAVSFWVGDDEYPVLLDANDECLVHEKVCKEPVFKISVTGLRPDGYTITSSKWTINQEV
jgi:hypothetical protein